MIGLASQSTRTSNFYCDRQGKCTWSVWSVTWISFLDLKAPQRLRLSQMSLPWDRDATLDGCGLNFGMCHRLALPFTLQEFERTTNLLNVFLTELCGLCILYLFVSCLQIWSRSGCPLKNLSKHQPTHKENKGISHTSSRDRKRSSSAINDFGFMPCCTLNFETLLNSQRWPSLLQTGLNLWRVAVPRGGLGWLSTLTQLRPGGRKLERGNQSGTCEWGGRWGWWGWDWGGRGWGGREEWGWEWRWRWWAGGGYNTAERRMLMRMRMTSRMRMWGWWSWWRFEDDEDQEDESNR